VKTNFDSHQNGTAIRIVPESRFTSHRNADSHGPESACDPNSHVGVMLALFSRYFRVIVTLFFIIQALFVINNAQRQDAKLSGRLVLSLFAVGSS
jgi:hypothetical protein